MQKIRDFLAATLSLAFLSIILGGGVFLLGKLVAFLLEKLFIGVYYIENLYKVGELPLPLILSIVTALATVTTAIITTLITKNNEARLQLRAEQRDKKILVYEELTEFFFKIIFANKLANPEESKVVPQEKEIVDFLIGYTPKIIMWGSDDVLRRFYLFRTQSIKVGRDVSKVTDLIFKFEDLLFAIRRDLGHKNKRLNKGTILGLFINDIENLRENSDSDKSKTLNL